MDNAEYASPDQKILELLRPRIQILIKDLKKRCGEAGFYIEIVRGLRTFEEQDDLYALGRTKPGAIATHCRGSFSFHNYGVAFDVRPLVEKDETDKKLELYKKAGDIGMSMGFDWGGSWEGFIDLPHFEYTAGYTIEDFRANSVDWSKFD
jgi:peptidoglycan L-alanyl-D-glutamate endopeptidase CwlK